MGLEESLLRPKKPQADRGYRPFDLEDQARESGEHAEDVPPERREQGPQTLLLPQAFEDRLGKSELPDDCKQPPGNRSRGNSAEESAQDERREEHAHHPGLLGPVVEPDRREPSHEPEPEGQDPPEPISVRQWVEVEPRRLQGNAYEADESCAERDARKRKPTPAIHADPACEREPESDRYERGLRAGLREPDTRPWRPLGQWAAVVFHLVFSPFPV